MSGIPLDPWAFPHQAGLYPSSYPATATAAAPRSDAAPVACPANVQLAGNDKLEAVPRERSQGVGSRVTFDVSLPGPSTASAPQLAAIRAVRGGDRVDLTVGGQAYAARAVAPAAPVMGGSWYRIRATAEA